MKPINVKMKKQKSILTNSNFGSMGWTLILFYFFALFYDCGLISDGTQILVPALSAARGWNQTSMLYFNSVAGYLTLAAYVPFGIWAQKKSPKMQATILTLTAGIAYIIAGIAPFFPVYLICICLTFMGSSGRCWISYAKMMANWFPRKKGIAMGWATIGNSASSMLFIPIMSALIVIGGPKLSCTVLGSAMIILGILAQIILKDTPEECGRYPDNITPEQEREYSIPSVTAMNPENTFTGNWTTAGILKTKEFWIISICCALMSCGSSCSIIYSIVRLQEFGFARPTALLINSCFAALACVGSIIWGWIDQKIGTKTAMIIYGIIFATAFFLNIGAASMGYNRPVMFISIFLFYWCIGGAAHWPVSLCASLFGRADFIKAQTPLTIIFTAGRMTAPSVLALGMGLTGGSLNGAFMIAAIILIAGIILMTFLNIPKFLEKYPLS